jgi:hypothetical protein
MTAENNTVMTAAYLAFATVGFIAYGTYGASS